MPTVRAPGRCTLHLVRSSCRLRTGLERQSAADGQEAKVPAPERLCHKRLWPGVLGDGRLLQSHEEEQKVPQIVLGPNVRLEPTAPAGSPLKRRHLQTAHEAPGLQVLASLRVLAGVSL